MKNYTLGILIMESTLFITGCSGPKSPSFEKLEYLKVLSANKSKVVLGDKALYHNPNNITGTLTKTNIKILVNEVEVTEINQEHSIAVPKAGDFRVPVKFSFNPQQLFKENNGFLRNALKSFVDKKMEVQYFGTVTVKVMGIYFDVPVDYSEKISFGLNYE
ncbi:hypothetical protein OAD66_08310 [Bacteroidia bacterium]|nr:hypothetical protein [Bacteroidia bacterium]MDB9883118.1 hypothetical protein [Bacteroidia bacterium]